MSERRILIAGTGSGCGKTTAACGILYGLQKRGLQAAAFKSGPDYIDPMFHKKALGISSGNLDLFFSGEDTVRRLLAARAKEADISVIEGAMGYYDGIGMTEAAGCHALAEATGTPVLLVVDPGGMGGSVLALLKGFLTYRTPNRIAGILFNRISGNRYEALKPYVEAMGVRAVGYIPRQEAFTLSSRHLGLVTADEVENFAEKLASFYELIRDTIDWELLLRLADGAAKSVGEGASSEGAEYQGLCGAGTLISAGSGAILPCPHITIGIARDEAFCFFYEDNIRYLEERGCRLKYFSPMRDERLPEGIDGLILCGGYPELYAVALAANEPVKNAVREAIFAGMPCIAECGGFLYLQKTLTGQDGVCHEMAGVLPGHGFYGKGLGRFGYITASLRRGSLFGRTDMTVRAHEFHYYRCDEDGDAFLAEKASGEAAWTTGIADDNLYAGFPHIYFYGNETFADSFLESCSRYCKRSNMREEQDIGKSI